MAREHINVLRGVNGAELWAITSYFNPMRYQRRLRNYHRFRDALQVPLVTVQLSYDGQVDLDTDDADILLSISDGEVLWQKERLLNVALKALPPPCRYVAWIDCDVLFLRSDWAEATARALDEHAMVQPFRNATYLDRDGRFERVRHSITSGVADGLEPVQCLTFPSATLPGPYASGLAWAARRELLDRHGFFDANIIGGGDKAMLCAAYDCCETVIDQHALNPAQTRRYLEWAVPFRAEVGDRVSYVEGEIVHLWHGESARRGLRVRQQRLSGLGFDPYTDIAIDEDGSWRWSSDKPALHRYLREYFASRVEDG